MTNKDILLLEQELPKISPPDMDRWFNYALVETIDRATITAKKIREVIKPKEKMAEYQDKLKELQEEHAEKDEYGEPIKMVKDIGGGRQIEKFEIFESDNPKGKFRIAVNKLEKEYKEAIDEFEERLKFLDEEHPDFEPYWVTMDIYPNGLSTSEGRVIFLMLEKPVAKKASKK